MMTIVRALAMLAMLLAAPLTAKAQDWPNRPITGQAMSRVRSNGEGPLPQARMMLPP